VWQNFLFCGNLSLAMQKVLTAEEMREVDRLTTEKYGIPSLLLMENAAHAAARIISEKLGGSVEGKSVLILCGKGNNGGDGAALARVFWTQGASVDVYLFGKVEDTKGDARINFEIIKKISDREFPSSPCLFLEEVEGIDEQTKGQFLSKDAIVDAVFGTGLTRPIDEKLANLFYFFECQRRIQTRMPLLVSIDMPSGLNANSASEFQNCFKASVTVTFTLPKPANVLPPNCNSNGELFVADIGSPAELIDDSPSKIFVTEKQDVIDWVRATKVRTSSYKKTRGTALIIAGSENYSGAAALAANACFAAGAGMVTAAVPKEIHQIVAAKTLAEVIVKPLENIDISKEKENIVALGCGLSNDAATHKFIRQTVINRQTPMVLDAEALNALAPFEPCRSNELPLILTPHIGEFSRLLGREVGEDKIAEVREFSEAHNVILVLKGERSLIAKPDGTVVINPTGNAGVSRAGAGDTLAGIITSFIAQTMQFERLKEKRETKLIDEIFNAVVAALYLAGVAGDIASEKFSQRLMTATDVRNCLQEAIERIQE
jgi:hydroxyethylthiazole kinase-like uncharacterized protein yjeF